MKKTLLIGNGPNRCISDSFSANVLINKLADIMNCENIKNVNKSFSFAFESIISINSDKDAVKNAFDFVVKELKTLNKTYNDIYTVLQKNLTKIDSIITTNYDFSIEYSIYNDCKVKTEKIGRNKGFKYSSSNNIDIYHIHGDCNHPKNLCLGFLGYQKYNKSALSNIKQKLDCYEAGAFELLKKQLPESLYKILINDVYIIGLNLNECETLLWNILLIRKELIRYDVYEKNSISQNRIVLYAFNDDEREINNDYYKNLGIEYKNIIINDNNYKEEYIKILESIININDD